MRKILLFLIFILFLINKSYAAVAMIKSNIDADYGIIKGSITIASTKKEQVIIMPYDDMQILYDDRRVTYNEQANKYIVEIDELAPVIISYIKHPSKYIDRIKSDYIAVYSSIIPSISNIENAELYLTLPNGFYGLVSEFFSISQVKDKTNTFLYTYNNLPKSIYLAASPEYVVKTVSQNNVKIYTLLFREHEDLSYKLLQKSAYYIEMYERLFNISFPYDSFMVVEDQMPYGHAMNGMAVFGKSIIDKPFVYERSLGHEVLHQYFGAAIECSMTDGNFLEAITTYFSDYFYEKDDRIKYRKDILSEYEAYAGTKGFPLKDFEYNAGKLEQAVGYGKGLMVLHMAKNVVGEEAFMNGIRAFVKDKMFSHASCGTDEDFYKTWIEKNENIALFIDNIVYKDKKLSFNLVRKGGQQQVQVPYIHISNGETKEGRLPTVIGGNNIEFELLDDNDTFIIDSGYHLMRHLYTNEIPAAFYYLFGSEEITYAGLRNTDNSFKDVFKSINEIVHIRKLSLHHIKDKNVIISLGNQVPANVAELLKGTLNFTFDMGNSTYVVVKNPYSKGNKFIMYAFNANKETLNKLIHYGSYSYLAFKDNTLFESKKDNTSYGIRIYGKGGTR